VAPTTIGPDAPSAISTPPRIVPIRIATNVPISMSALPPMSSSSARCCGRMLYFTGPNSVEWMPMQKRQVIRIGALASQKPIAPTHMIPISSSFTARMIRVFSILSAS
jgi:hypothetical protein